MIGERNAVRYIKFHITINYVVIIVRKKGEWRESLSTTGLLMSESIRPIHWKNDCLYLLDQRLLPHEEKYLQLHSVSEVAAAIRDMVVRGAPAIGITAAYGVVLAARAAWEKDPGNWRQLVQADLDMLAQARPTAVNLVWALERMRTYFDKIDNDPGEALLQLAQTIHAEDISANRLMGEAGAGLLQEGCRVLTHCNTGSLATGGYGTALGVIRSAWKMGTLSHVYASETRPWLQGARLTLWECLHDHIPVTLIADSAAAFLMAQGRIDWVIVGADRIVANGDVANKIGTYNLAVAARYHGVRMMVVAPVSTIDPGTPNGAAVPIEDRGAGEITAFAGQQLAPEDVAVWNPVFDITPADLVGVIVTERGILQCPDQAKIAAILD